MPSSDASCHRAGSIASKSEKSIVPPLSARGISDTALSVDAAAGHHALSHDGSPDGRAALLRLETWQCEQAADFASKLRAAKDSDGSSLLDNTALLLLPDMGDGNPHDHTNLAPAIVGGCRGALETGKGAKRNIEGIHIVVQFI